DFIGHATCPIVHAADDRSVMESLESLPHIAHSVHRLWPGLAYHLGPSTLAALRNPYGRAPRPNPERLRMPLADTDPRHQAAFGAAWTLGYAAAVAAQEVQVLSLHHSHGPSGPLLDPAHPDAATSGPGACVPGWNVLAALAQAQGRPLLACDGLPSALSALAWQTGGGHPAVLIANLGQADIRLACPAGSLARALHHPFQRTAPQLLQAVPHAGLWLQPYDTLLLHVPAAA
ncbi:MAG: hypothetical protein KGI67_09240, partial [Pseudomonadota bacterium]|nr:hypothetical protein [Pseudomonadota bacterium]